jgi:hypothetical protein
MPDDAERLLLWGVARPLAASQRASPATPFGERLRKSEGAEKEREIEPHGSSLLSATCESKSFAERRGRGRLKPEGFEGGTPVPPT